MSPLASLSRSSLRLCAGSLVCLLLAACQAPIRPDDSVSQPSPLPSVAGASIELLPEPEPPAPEPDVFERLRARLGDDHCEDSATQARWVRLYAPRQRSLMNSLQPMLPLLDYVLRQIEAAGLPGEFALIPIIESSYRPQARSPQGPAGLWQFTADTARGFGLEVGGARDERLAVVESTEAALRLLGTLQDSHGDWVLAAAAYNAGAYRVRKLLERSPPPAEGSLPTGLARGTYDYIDKLKAWACMLSEPERFGLTLPASDSFEILQPVSPPAALMRADLISEVSGLSLEQLRALNPLLRTSPPARAEHQLLLPEDAAAELLAFMQRVQRGEATMPPPPPPEPSVAARTHVIRSGDTLSRIAQQHGLRVRDLTQWNRLEPRALLRIGQVLRLEP